jgi:predicted O-methyltransferase YrrM
MIGGGELQMGGHVTADGRGMPPTALTELETLALERRARDGVVLELGAELGYSTLVMGRVARMVVSVDWHRGYAGWNANRDTALEYLYNIKELREKVIPVIGRFEDVLPLLAAESFDFVFLDGGHTWDQVVFCVEQCRRLVKPGGMVATHDYGHPICSEKAVLEMMGIRPLDPVIGTLALLGDLR